MHFLGSSITIKITFIYAFILGKLDENHENGQVLNLTFKVFQMNCSFLLNVGSRRPLFQILHIISL